MRLGEWKRLLSSVDSWDYQQMVRIILYNIIENEFKYFFRCCDRVGSQYQCW